MKKKQLPSNKSLGIVFFIFYYYCIFIPTHGWRAIEAMGFIHRNYFLLLGLINSKILTPLNIIWINLGLKLGGIIAPLIMTLIYFVVVTPIGVLMRQFKDPLNLKKRRKEKLLDKEEKKYWNNEKSILVF